MNNDNPDFTATISNYLVHLVKTAKDRVQWPVSALRLLCFFIDLSARMEDNGLSKLSLADLPRFEEALQDLALRSSELDLTISRQGRSVSLVDVNLAAREGYAIKKRKRYDEDDSGEDEPSSDVSNLLLSHSGSQGNPRLLEDLHNLLEAPSAKSRLLAKRFQSTDTQFEPICASITKETCVNKQGSLCNRVHFRIIMRPHTDPTLGHCSYLNTCYSEPSYALSPSIPPTPSRFPGQQGQQGRFAPPEGGRGPSSLPSGLGAGGRGKDKAPCRYLHYEVDWDEGDEVHAEVPLPTRQTEPRLSFGNGPEDPDAKPYPPQWIDCDVRQFDLSVLGKFHVIMADPPWDIHMSLPYGTMTDQDMESLPVPQLQDEGLLFLWVTGRAMEIGRNCLKVWGYRRIDEIVWVKTNQLQRIIRAGRTGHWLNHTKEHLLVGLKSKVNEKGEPIWPRWINRGVDTDVIVSEVRETSRKPDEAYSLIERMCPGGRKLEIFGRKHNAQPGWLTLGNQLGTDRIFDPDLAQRVLSRYPERERVPHATS